MSLYGQELAVVEKVHDCLIGLKNQGETIKSQALDFSIGMLEAIITEEEKVKTE